ncbi:MAG: 4-hydroxybenzoyl-CoA reductase [Acidobacteria bacterium]|nr:MAG: 4-hydroxybenzoyl-CoA reductase [Acidobacteriota bacterium]
MLRLPPFDFHTPGSLAEVLEIVAGEGPETRVVAGGTDLWPNMKRRHQRAERVVSLMAIPELAGIHAHNGELALGSTTTLEDTVRTRVVAERFPALARAVASISSPPLRNMGTIGGNICVDTRCTYYNQTEEWRRSIDYCMKEKGTICWVAPSSPRCWAHTASDSAPVLCALGARVEMKSKQGERIIPLTDFYRDDGIEYLDKAANEVVTRILIPDESDSTHCRSSFWKLRRRGSIDFAVLSVAAAVWTDDGDRVTDARIYLGAVGSRPLPVTGLAECLEGKVLDEETVSEAAALARKTATPMDNTDFQAQWRGVMAARYTEAALGEIAGLEPRALPPPHLL